MNKQLKVLSRTIFGLFIVLFGAVTVIQVFEADSLRANPLNQRTTLNALQIERGPILVKGSPIVQSLPADDEYMFQRTYLDPASYAPVTGYFSNYQGMTGVEASANSALSGTGDNQFFARIMRIMTGAKPQGSAVELTLDPAVQEAAWNAMADYSGAAVAYDVKTGKVLSLVSTPSFDPNFLASNNDLEIIENYRLLTQDPQHPLHNRAIAGDLYHPGSTYKLISAAAAIESGAAKPSTKLANDKEFKLPGSSAVIENASRDICAPGDKVTLETALAYSCNVPFADLATKMDEDVIPNMAAKFGFGQELEIPLDVTPSTAPIPLDKAEAAISAIGQLDVRSTPLQMAMVAAAIANDGVIMKPQLINQVISPDLKVETALTPEIFAEPISDETAKQLKDMMILGVDSPEGAAAPAKVDGAVVGGKTGTAENGQDGDGNNLPYTLWFTGFVETDDSAVAIAVVVESGGGQKHDFVGTSYEIPTAIGREIMEAVLNR